VIEEGELLRANTVQISSWGFPCHFSKNGLIGVQLAQEQVPDLILCDADAWTGLVTVCWPGCVKIQLRSDSFILPPLKPIADLHQGMELRQMIISLSPYFRRTVGDDHYTFKKKPIDWHDHKIAVTNTCFCKSSRLIALQCDDVRTRWWTECCYSET